MHLHEEIAMSTLEENQAQRIKEAEENLKEIKRKIEPFTEEENYRQVSTTGKWLEKPVLRAKAPSTPD